MPCLVRVDHEIEEEILDLDEEARRQIGGFLLALQDDPLPQGRLALTHSRSASAFYTELRRGFYVSWEIVGDMLHLALTGKCDGLLVRVLGIDRQRP